MVTRGSRVRRLPGSELVLIAVAFLAYMTIRALGVGDRERALVHARSMLRWEHLARIDVERGAQHVVAAPGFGRELFTAVYVWGYWPVVIGALIYTRFRHPRRYRVLRNALFVSGALGLVCFATFPVAPPRMLENFVDTVPAGSRAHFVAHPSGLVNAYAAFPSFHIGWFAIAWLAVVWGRALIAQLAGLAATVLMALAVVVTANHYVLDVVGGLLISGLGLAVAYRFEMHQRRDGRERQWPLSRSA